MRFLWLTQLGLSSMPKGDIVGIDVVMICLVDIDVNLLCWSLHLCYEVASMLT